MTAIATLQGVEAQVHLWLSQASDCDDEALLERYLELLDEEELKSHSELANPEHRREYLVSRAFLRDVLSHYAEAEPQQIEFERNASGKPAIKSAAASLDLQFNLSHSAGLIACAVTRAGAIGVDVESFSDDAGMLSVADHYFSPRELKRLRDQPAEQQPEQFCRTWTLKEAYIKARGQGLEAGGLDSFGFECAESGGIRFYEAEQLNSDWQFWSLKPRPDCLVAIAVAANDCTLRVFSGAPLKGTRELALDTLGQVA
jgi:4'-phosphopantetheinyl transferase